MLPHSNILVLMRRHGVDLGIRSVYRGRWRLLSVGGCVVEGTSKSASRVQPRASTM